jgi:acyl-coenzyme A synthetase/AMP-(fatty) acid ligase
VWARKEDGTVAAVDEEGELIVQGATVMLGYWGGERIPDGTEYATGDLVQHLGDGCYQYVGRKDDMVKVRGNRVEPGEIEAVLVGKGGCEEAAVIPIGSGLDTRLVAFVSGSRSPRSLLEAKQVCAEHLPSYMVVDDLHTMETLPRNTNGKIDRRRLASLLEKSLSHPGGRV